MSDAKHPQEVALVWRGATGIAIPTREFDYWLLEAKRLGPAHVDAMSEQVKRQASSLGCVLVATPARSA